MMWLDVVGYEDLFMVSDCGQVFSKRTNKILKQTKTKSGYLTIATKIGGRGGKNVCFRVHRLVAEAFVDNPHDKPHINHIDGNKTNNNFSNLEWVTPKENTIHSWETGLSTMKKGVENKNACLSQEDIDKIHRWKGEVSQRAIAKTIGVSKDTVRRVINGERYE